MIPSNFKAFTREELEEIESWQPPNFYAPLQSYSEPEPEPEPDPEDLPILEAPRLPTADEIEAIQQQARQEGFEAGRQEGFEYGHRQALEEGRIQIKEKLAMLDHIMTLLDEPLKQMDHQVEQELLVLAGHLVRHLTYMELRQEPGRILALIREAMDMLPVAARHPRLILHPDDAALVRDAYATALQDMGWTIKENPTITRGGCRVESETSRLDATLETRLERLLEAFFTSQHETIPT